jgi:hypothetical protein
MAQIQVVIDPMLNKRSIEMPLEASSVAEAGDAYKQNQADVMQTKVYGILTPLIKINNLVVDFSTIDRFYLSSEGPLPTISLAFFDHTQSFENFSLPGNDNYVLVQILPPFEKAYKKINLEFYITRFDIDGIYISLDGVYKLPDFTSAQFKALGKLSTTEMCETIAKETKLGFATNVKDTSDKRWMYCNHISYNDLLRREIKYSGNGPQTIYDWWIDFWDYINLVNIRERYNSIDSGDDMKVWISNTPMHDVSENIDYEPIYTHCALSNSPVAATTDLAIKKYNIINMPGSQYGSGTDHVYSIYDQDLGEYKDVLVQDGDIKRDAYQKYEYVGETIGGHNYLLSKKLRDSYMQKMMSEQLEIILKTPMLGIHRGSKVDVLIYENDSNLDFRREAMEDAEMDIETKSNINTDDRFVDGENVQKDGVPRFKIKQNLSGQYYVLYNIIEYEDGQWSNHLFVIRPADSKYDPFNEWALRDEKEKNAQMENRDNVEGIVSWARGMTSERYGAQSGE